LNISTYNFQTDGFSSSSNGNMSLGNGVRGGVEWMRKLAYRYRRIREIYSAYRNNPSNLLSGQKREEWAQLRNDIEVYTDNWSMLALKCLSVIKTK
jgi:hypothetical protein